MENAPLIDEELAAFLQSGVALHAASRDAGNVPQTMRAVGCRVAADRRRLSVFLFASQCAALLADLAANGAIAFVASLPSTHRTVQLKGVDAAIGAPLPGDEALVLRQRDAFTADLVKLGYDASLPVNLVGGDWADVVAVSFTPTSAFAQSPGPGAGAALGSKR